jgi:hypothetical protein
MSLTKCLEQQAQLKTEMSENKYLKVLMAKLIDLNKA